MTGDQDLFNSEWYERVDGVLAKVRAEREHQHTKFGGTQFHSLATWFLILGEEFGEAATDALEAGLIRADCPEKTELIQRCRHELVQVAAVAVAMVEAIDRGNAR